MPTRYSVDLPLDKVAPKDLKDPMKRKKVRFQTRVKLEERYAIITNLLIPSNRPIY